MSRISDYNITKQELQEKKNELWRLQQEYKAIVEQEPYMNGRLKNRQHTIYKLAGEIKSLEKELKQMEKYTKDAMDMLKLIGYTKDEKIYRGRKSVGTLSTRREIEAWGGDADYDFEWEVRNSSGTLVWGNGGANSLSAAEQQMKAAMKKADERWSKDSCGEKVYTKGESTEDQCKDGGPGSGIKGHTGGEPMAKLSKSWTPENINHIMRNPHLYREEVVEEAARKSLENKGLLKKAKDDDATEMGSFEQLGQNHETEAMEPEEHPTLAQDDEVGEKFKTVMEEFSKGELKSSSGEKVTDPKQAKAIAYSEQREAKDAIPTDWDVGLFDGKWYITKNGRKVKGPFSSYKAAKRVLENSKMYLEDSDPKVAEAMKIINLSGGAM